jgi:hypothetical protein
VAGTGVGVAVRVAVAVGVAVAGAGVGVGCTNVRLRDVNAPVANVPVAAARAVPAMNVTVAPSVPQPGCVNEELTSITYWPPETLPVPQVALPTIAVMVVAVVPVTVPKKRFGGVGAPLCGVAVG